TGPAPPQEGGACPAGDRRPARAGGAGGGRTGHPAAGGRAPGGRHPGGRRAAGRSASHPRPRNRTAGPGPAPQSRTARRPPAARRKTVRLAHDDVWLIGTDEFHRRAEAILGELRPLLDAAAIGEAGAKLRQVEGLADPEDRAWGWLNLGDLLLRRCRDAA